MKMLAANVLCLKKRKKKKGEYILNLPGTILVNDGKGKGRKPGTMLHITEDTPADMLSGAMDLTIHLPSDKAVKMCVERRTPMMDLLVQITTNHQLQITNYTLQPLQATSSNESIPEKVLAYYPNTPIGALDTQHIKVIPKTRTLPNVKNALPGAQPFETTFRLKVHLPRNQLYVTRVSKHVHIDDIMRKVCEEKSLDPNKYEVRHPGNLDEILDPKLTLHDYMITEINLVVKGSNTNTGSFTSEDIMSLKKDEEKKPTPNKTGGVFNLFFRRGKSNNVTTTTSPTKETAIPHHREEPPTKPPPPISAVPKQEPQKEKPKVPQRKRRPAPKPPQPPQPVDKPDQEEPVQMRNGSVISDTSNGSETGGKHEPGLTICHSRHSSDSSGYHETSILSDHCNTSLPRRNRMEEAAAMGRKLNRYSESTGNLTKMTSHSRSTSSLIFPGRKKKAAPPPPKPLQTLASSTTNLESLSPVVASQTPISSASSKTDLSLASQGTQKSTYPPPIPRRRKGPTPSNSVQEEENPAESEYDTTSQYTEESLYSCPYQSKSATVRDTPENSRPPSNMSTMDILKSLEYLNLDDQGNEIKPPAIIGVLPKTNQNQEEDLKEDTALTKRPFQLNLVDKGVDDDNTSVATESPVKYENSIISDISSIDVPPRKRNYQKELSVTSLKSSESVLFQEGRIGRWGSWERLNESSVASSPIDEKHIYSTSEENLRADDEALDAAKDNSIQMRIDRNSSQDKYCTKVESSAIKKEDDEEVGNDLEESLKEMESLQDPIKKSCDDAFSDKDVSSTSSHPPHKLLVSNGKPTTPREEKEEILNENLYNTNVINEISLDDVERYKCYGNSPDSGNSSEISEKSKIDDELNSPEVLDVLVANEVILEEWQLPSPPKAFKDTFPNSQTIETTETDSVITPELIEKLERIEKEQTVKNNEAEDNELILSKLSLENLEKRKSLVYNRELATSLKLSYETEALKNEINATKSNQTSKPPNQPDATPKAPKKEEPPVVKTKQSTLPNFKITTYDEPRQVKVFEDDTIRSNSDFSGKSQSLNRGQALQKSSVGKSMENISMRRNESDDVFKKPKEMDHRIFRPKTEHFRRPVNRSGSFSAEQNEWSPSRPVARSKSQVALRKGERKSNTLGTMSKSSSLFDVSGLQSLEVMKKIQNKLNTPTTSMETLTKIESEKRLESKPKPADVEEVPTRKYQYTGPPSVNMSTWSDRPRVPVSVKEDADYKLGQGTNKRHLNGPKPFVATPQQFTNETILRPKESQRVTITCNGSSEGNKDYNVLIKIEDQNRRFPEYADSYRTSYSVNKSSQRPHSVAFPSDFDISRVPVVRSVELKKNFRDIPNNTSVIQLNQSNDYYSNGFSEKSRELSQETVTNVRDARPVMRAKSFLQAAPVVRGFRTLEHNSSSNNTTSINQANNRFSWQPTTSMTLPSTPKKDTFSTNRNVPFSRFNLRRTESKTSTDDWATLDRNQDFPKASMEAHNETNSFVKPVIPKPPPQMPITVQKKITKRQFVPVLDPRDELLKSIRDFGGKKGLRSRKA